MKKYSFIALVLFAFSCGVPEEEHNKVKEELAQAKAELDSTKASGNEFADKLMEVSDLIQTIETSEESLNVGLDEGISYDDYKTKVDAIKNDMEKSRQRIADLEHALGKAGNKSKVLNGIIGKLKKDLAEKETTIETLNAQVEKYKSENSALSETVEIQRGEIELKEAEIAKKKEELSDLNDQLSATQQQALEDAGDAFYQRGRDNELLAEKTKLAPKKKKQHYADAYEMYKQAFELGKTEAYAKMKDMQEKMK